MKTDVDQLFVLIAYKERSLLYLDAKTKKFMKADLTQLGLQHSEFKGDHWTLDQFIFREGYTTIDGVLVEPVEEKLILLESERHKYIADVSNLGDKIRLFVGYNTN